MVDICHTKAIIEPSEIIKKRDNFPKNGVSCFSLKLIKKTAEKYGGIQIASLASATGRIPVYKIFFRNEEGKTVETALFPAAVGAPACVMQFEECIAMGLENLVQFGSCGRLVSDSISGGIIIPTAAICDEGTSSHYIDPSFRINRSDFQPKANERTTEIEIPEIAVDREKIGMIMRVMERHSVYFTEGKTWTTDGVYRETKEKADYAVRRGAVCVEMECAAMIAAAEFRGVGFFPFLFGADDLSQNKWKPDGLTDPGLHADENIMALALEIASEIK